MPSPDDIFQRRLARETNARKQAEALLEQKSLELFIEAEERQQALARLRESEERYRGIVEMSPDAIMIEVNGQLVFANSAAKRLFGETEYRQLTGRTLEQLGLDDEHGGATPEPTERIEALAMRLDGSTFEVAVRCMPLVYDGQPAMQVVARDISDRKRLEKQLAYQATHDALTGVSNRSALLTHLDDALAQARRNRSPVWVAFLDLDRFKQVNDRLGHRAGDQLLETVTSRLSRLLRKGDLIGRYGGDEFILVMRGAADAELNPQMLERIMQEVGEPVEIDGHTLHVTCSLGVTSFPEDGHTPQLLLDRADAAMYRAKQSGRNAYQLYNREIHERIVERAQIESAIAHALEQKQFFLAYQPQVDIRSGAIVGAEALLRWNHPELGVVPPNRFIPIAEESHAINRIGAWVLEEACRQCREWHDEGLGPLTIAVNLSVRQLNGFELVRLVERTLASTGLPANCLKLELTESMMMSDVEMTLDTLRVLHAKGVQIVIDDFGTGYSSFAYLNRLPLSSLKIDRQFITDLGKPGLQEAAMITRALIQLAHNLGLRVVAEGVELPSQLEALREQGCDEIQGWLHSRAMPPGELSDMLRNHSGDAWRQAGNVGLSRMA